MKNPITQTLDTYPPGGTDNLMPILQQMQAIEGYVSPTAIRKISEHLRISRSRIFGVASFYSQFRFNPPGRHSIKICLGSACHVQDGDFLLNALQLQIGIEPGQTSEDGRFDLERVACLGCCALAPVMMVDQEIHSRMSVLKLQQVLKKYE
ncbi:NADH-quinone oxidoreductase subunit NuoE [Desulfopila inferna]|nr:NADH-quinone oxidoreductase subunit NuoE [Desulfopila inferna]